MYRPLVRLVSRIHHRRISPGCPPSRRTLQGRVERLEDRRVLATGLIVVDPVADSVTILGTPDADRADVSYPDAEQIRLQIRTGDDVRFVSLPRADVRLVVFRGGDGDDELYNRTEVAARASGETGDDRLVSGGADDILIGGLGADSIDGGAGNDRLDGGEHIDVLVGGLGNDTLIGGSGNDTLEGEAGADLLRGDQGDDLLLGGSDADLLRGEDGNDQLFGGANDDRLYGGPGTDSLVGGDGADLASGEDGDDSTWGEEGDDTLLGALGNDMLSGGDGDDRLDGGGHADQLQGGTGNDTLHGGAGVDTLDGDGGADVLLGDEGQDLLRGDLGADLLRGGPGNDQLFGGPEDDRLYGESGADTLTGGAGEDLIDGDEGNDQLWGDEENDTLLGGPGNDALAGGDGNDRLDGGEHADQTDGGAGDDTHRGGLGDDLLEDNEGADRLVGDEGQDLLRAGLGADVLEGGAGDDRLFAGAGPDTVRGGDGEDVLEGDQDDDWMFGDAGFDRLFGGDGNDALEGGAGPDYLSGNAGQDRAWGNEGRDTLLGNDGDDFLSGDQDSDQLFGNNGTDTLQGGSENDELRGEDGDDFLRGDGGHDTAGGGDGADVVFGGDDDDVLAGGGGRDLLVGGPGTDHAFGGSGDDILIGAVADGYENDAVWHSIRDIWSSTLDYGQRLARLQDTTQTPHLKSTSTVHDDLLSDTLFGNSEQDWYIVPVGHDEEAHDHGHACEHLDSLDQVSDLEAEERIESNVPHPTSKSLRTEHCALFALVDLDDVTHVAVASGDFSQVGTWRDGQIPGAGSRIWIPAGITVTVSGSIDEPAETIRVSGTLAFDPSANTELHVETVVVDPSGVLQMGTNARPIDSNRTARIVITDDGPIDRNWDPLGLSRGLLVHGKAQFFGAEKTPWLAATSIDSTSQPGRSILQFDTVPTGWRIHDQLVIAGTSREDDQHETRTILAINGSRVVVAALDHDHATPSDALRVHVGNLTRNVEIRSQTPGSSRGGHVMFMHTRDVQVHNAGFVGLGRSDKKQVVNDSVLDANGRLVPGTGTNSRGRYALHFHRNGVQNDGHPAEVTGSVVVDSPGWGYVNHGGFVNFRDNIAYDVDGAGFVTENGSEIGEMINNLAIYGRGSGASIVDRRARHDFGHQGDGFWIHGPGVRVVGNVASGQHGNGFVFFTQGLVEGDFGTATFSAENIPDPTLAAGQAEVPVGDVPLLEFRDNVAYANSVGLTLRYHLQDVAHDAQTTVEDLVLWNNTRGVLLPYSAQTVLRNVQVLGSDQLPIGVGIEGNALTEGITFDRVHVAGYAIGLRAPQRGTNVIQDSYFNNLLNIEVATAAENARQLTITGAIEFGTLPASVLRGHEQILVGMKADFSPVQDSVEHVFASDRVILDFGPFADRRLFYFEQRADFIPFPTDDGFVANQYIGKKNRQLWDQFGLAVGGQIVPATAREHVGIQGLLQ